jgi:LEA14-like dessication related protein
MNNNTIIRCIASLLLLVSCHSNPIKDPVFIESKNFRVGKLGFQKSTVNVTLDYYNPNGFGLTLEGADLDVYVGDKLVGKTILNERINIPAKDTFSIPVKMDVEMKNLVSNLMMVGLNEDVELTLKGSSRLKKAGIGITFPINYTGRHKLR